MAWQGGWWGFWRQACIYLISLARISRLFHRTPATTGVFIYLNIPRSLKNSIQYLAPSPTSTADVETLSLLK
jgi:hypothetical protein